MLVGNIAWTLLFKPIQDEMLAEIGKSLYSAMKGEEALAGCKTPEDAVRKIKKYVNAWERLFYRNKKD